MRHAQGLIGLLGGVGLLFNGSLLRADEPSSQKPTPANESAHNEFELKEPWLEAIPVPADPELEAQIQEIQEALGA
ncbi:MAG: hypothetical protein HYZ91_04635, partial [Candidatus Omnitrophica bacterium]|nr:hypothetical protein [Candidatus Omnitrophota bacterium]